MIDSFDKRILQIIQENSLTSQREIGEIVGLSAAAVHRRIKRMKEAGIVDREVAIVNRDKVGANVTILVELFLESEKIEEIDAIKTKFNTVPEIQQCFYITGESDFFLILVVPSMAYYESLTRELFFENKNIKKFRTTVVMDVAKSSLKIPKSVY